MSVDAAFVKAFLLKILTTYFYY